MRAIHFTSSIGIKHYGHFKGFGNAAKFQPTYVDPIGLSRDGQRLFAIARLGVANLDFLGGLPPNTNQG